MVVLACAAAPRTRAQTPADSAPAPTVDEARRIEGRVVKPGLDDVVGVPGLRVTLHRVGPDGAGPIDSTVTGEGGRYRFAYRARGSADAVFFVSATYAGIAYFSSPTRAPVATADDAGITVFDTTSKAVHVHVAGQHLVVAAPHSDGRREIAQVFELQNDTSVTFVSGDSTKPTWRVHLPEGATAARVSEGDIAAAATTIADGEVRVFAPLSPGIRQLAVMYVLPSSAFPLDLPLQYETGVLEVLTEEPTAVVTGAGLTKRERASTQGRTFIRYLGQDAPASAVVRVAVGASPGAVRGRYLTALAAALGAVMVLALVWAFRRRRGAAVAIATAAPTARSESESLVRAIAALDAEFERQAAPTAEQRAVYDRERATLKARLAALLAAERGPG